MGTGPFINDLIVDIDNILIKTYIKKIFIYPPYIETNIFKHA